MKSKVAKKAVQLTNEQKTAMFRKIKSVSDYQTLAKAAWRRRCFKVMDDQKLLKAIIAAEKTPCILRRAKKRLERLIRIEKRGTEPKIKAQKKTKEHKAAPAKVKEPRKVLKVKKTVAAQAAAVTDFPDTDKPTVVVPKKKTPKVKAAVTAKPVADEPVPATTEIPEE